MQENNLDKEELKKKIDNYRGASAICCVFSVIFFFCSVFGLALESVLMYFLIPLIISIILVVMFRSKYDEYVRKLKKINEEEQRQKRHKEIMEEFSSWGAEEDEIYEIECVYCGGVYSSDEQQCPHCGSAKGKK